MSTDNSPSDIEEFDLFHNVSAEQLSKLKQNMKERSMKKGEVLRFSKSPHHYVFFLKKGIIKAVAYDHDGHELIKYIISAGHLFGEIPLLEKIERPDAYAQALEPSIVNFIDADALKQTVLENEELRIKINQQIADRIQLMENRLIAQSFNDARTRICSFIMELIKDFGRKTDKGYEVNNFLTNDDISKVTITSRQTVSQVLNELRDKHLLDYNTQRIIVPLTSDLINYKKNADEFVK